MLLAAKNRESEHWSALFGFIHEDSRQGSCDRGFSIYSFDAAERCASLGSLCLLT